LSFPFCNAATIRRPTPCRSSVILVLYLERKLRLTTHIERDAFQRRCSCNHLASVKDVLAPGIAPGSTGRQIHLALASASGQDRSDQQIRPTEKLIFDRPGGPILGKLQEERTHQRNASLAGQPQVLQQVGSQALTQEEQLLENNVGLLT